MRTEGPWIYDKDYPENVYSDDSTGSIILTCKGFDWAPRPEEEQRSNAQFIVMMENNWDEMVATLKMATDQLERAVSGDRVDTGMIDLLLERTLIKKVQE